MEAVEAKCGGCERGLLFRWGWHGGGEGTAGTSSQESHRGLTGFHHGVWRAREELFGSVVMRRGRHDTVLWCETY